MLRMRLNAGLALLLVALGGCAVNPVTGKSEVAFVSESQEMAIGEKNYSPYRQAQGGDYVVEPELTTYVQSVGQRLAKVSDRKLPYEFNIINDSTPNAWALPGGKISINRGLLVELQSEAELAAVLGHEIVHAAARHSAQAMERGVFLQGALVAAGVALGGTDYRDVGLLGANLGAQLTNQKFGRDDESEADLYGMRYMVRAGYDPAAAVRLQETFVRLFEGKDPGWLDGLFASHPPSRERVEANKKTVQQLGNPGGEIGEARYQKAIARLKRSKPAYEAYDKAKTAMEKSDLKTATSLVDEAIRIEPKEALFFGLRGEIKTQQKNEKGALNDLNKAVALNPDYFRPLLARAVVRGQNEDLKGAAQDFERSAALLPTADAYFGLGLVAQASGNNEKAVSYLQRAAASQSEVGKEARQQLARLDLNSNPARYITAGLGLARDGYLVARVANNSDVDVRNVRVQVGPRTASGLRTQQTLTLDRPLAAGQSIDLRTSIGPLSVGSARGYGAQVSHAELAQ